MSSALFRFIGSLGRNIIVANTFGSFGLLTIFVLGGFILARDDIKGWWIWCYWFSPMMYGQNGLAVNEFLGDSWNKLSEAEAETDNEIVFDSGRTAAADDGLFSEGSPDKDKEPPPAPAPAPINYSATQYEPISQAVPTPEPATAPAADKESSPGPEGRKRKREEETSIQKQLIEAMERNGRLLSSQLEIQNTNAHLDREQRKDYANGLFSVLNKLADAMARIADKL